MRAFGIASAGDDSKYGGKTSTARNLQTQLDSEGDGPLYAFSDF
jgi:hypothetical protein